MLNLLLRVNQRGAHERLLLNLNFALTGLEYQVQEVNAHPMFWNCMKSNHSCGDSLRVNGLLFSSMR
jgi:hypothetical protein